jgi:fimbrial chaperone protein
MKLATQSRCQLFNSIWLIGFLGCPQVAGAAGLMISPVVIEVESARKAIAVTVTNQSDKVVRFQTDTMLWQQVNGTDRFEPSDELLVVPPIVEVPPNASQVFRVILRAPKPATVERTYRIILEDVSDPLTSVESSAVSFRFVHNLPVLIAPSVKPTAAVKWAPCAFNGAMASINPPETCLRLLNAGNRRVKVQNLTVAGDGWKQDFPVKDGFNILAGAEREWRIPLQAGQTGALRSVQVQTARGETLQAELGGF